MPNHMQHIYGFAGRNVAVRFSDPCIELILQAYFRHASVNGPATHRICFIPVNADTLASANLLSQYAPEIHDQEGILSLPLDAFRCYYVPWKKTIFSFYPAGIFSESQETKGFDLVYENTYNDQELPPHTSEVVYTLYWFLECLNIFRLHAAYVRYKNVHILLAGSGAVGKTTSALNLSLAGGEIYCDDEILFHYNETTHNVEVFPVGRPVAVTAQTLDMFNDRMDAQSITQRNRHKYLISHNLLNIKNIHQPSWPDLIVFPGILAKGIDDTPVTQRLSLFEGFTNFLNQEILFPPIEQHRKQPQLEIVEALIRQCQAYSILSGPDMTKNLNVYDRVISTVSDAKSCISHAR